MPDSYATKEGRVRWRARWRTGGGERHSKAGFETERAARAYEEAMRSDRRKGQPVRRPASRMTVDDYWQHWWTHEVTVAKARATQYSYRDIYTADIAPRLGR